MKEHNAQLMTALLEKEDTAAQQVSPNQKGPKGMLNMDREFGDRWSGRDLFSKAIGLYRPVGIKRSQVNVRHRRTNQCIFHTNSCLYSNGNKPALSPLNLESVRFT